MKLWSWMKGTKGRSRKDPGELTPEDYAKFPVWEFAIDEEGVAGQSECTVRPVNPLKWPGVFDYIVATRVTFANGDVRAGAFQVNSFGIAEAKPPAHYSHWMLLADGQQLHLYLAAEQWQSDEQARVEMAKTYSALHVTGKTMFPAIVRPVVPIPGMPEQWELSGFMRARHASNRNAFLT
jgi:hypothetical protein